MALPPGQRVYAGPMPRFGLDTYMKRRAVTPRDFKLRIGGDVEKALELTPEEIFAVRECAESGCHPSSRRHGQAPFP
jgi:hypothetical protein